MGHSLQTSETFQRVVVQIGKTDLAIAAVHRKLKKSAVEADQPGETGGGDELGYVEPYLVGDVVPYGHGEEGRRVVVEWKGRRKRIKGDGDRDGLY